MLPHKMTYWQTDVLPYSRTFVTGVKKIINCFSQSVIICILRRRIRFSGLSPRVGLVMSNLNAQMKLFATKRQV